MKIVLITGGSGGIGASAARQCAADGMGVIVTYNNHPDSAEDVVKEIDRAGGRAAALKLDVARTGSFGALRNELKNVLRHIWMSVVLLRGWLLSVMAGLTHSQLRSRAAIKSEIFGSFYA
ncbi:SDR family NAD(P)-dependent oxidoreductase [Pantoea alhagi]|uniref:SDR family NAD(P)-dependent oxidoreductase n=1 Tax=Pantoea alhagi TaxID=1891675 RepID=UPI000A15841F|nr:SDR family NAD(P)-dependent oxidoreductase [Pantoea alhagi]